MDNYYSVARIRALETHLLSAEQIARMAAAADFESAFSVLSETKYGEHLHALKSPFDFEELCRLERIALKNLLTYLAPKNETIEALFSKQQNQVLRHSPSPLIRRLARSKIDLANILTLLRCQELDKKLAPYLIEGGRIDKDTLIDLSNKKPTEIAARLNFTPYFPAMAQGFEYYAKNKSFYLIEKQMDDYIIQQFKSAKYLNCGIEPLVGFYLAKESEIRTVRFILIGKKNYVETERIKERVRVTY